MGNQLAIKSNFDQVVQLVIDDLSSEHSRRAYSRAITAFLGWWEKQGRPGLSKATVNRYKVDVLEAGDLSASTINQRLSAIRKLAQEASDNGLLDHDIANGISKAKGVKAAGVRAGNWLTKAQAQGLINAPDISTIKGLRDRAILACLLGCGLRRSEAASLTFEHIQQREGRWVIVDLIGKGGRVRSVPVPAWAKVAIDAWAGAAGLSSGKVFRGVYHYGHSLQPESKGITAQAVANMVHEYSLQLGLDFAAHDLRRTWAKLAYKGGADLGQIQITLGHAKLETTEKYLGITQDLTDAPCDKLGLDLSGD